MLTAAELHNFYTTISETDRSQTWASSIYRFVFGNPSITGDQFRILQEWFPEVITGASLSGREITPQDSAQIVAVFQQTYQDEDALIKHHLGLDTWVTEGNKTEAVKRIVSAFKDGTTYLDLCRLGLTSLPDSIGNLTNLADLFCFNNSISALPESIGNLINLKRLTIDSNELSALPESIGNLTKLECLDIAGNRLSALPVSITTLTNLAYLDIAANELSTLPESIGNLTNLEYLNIAENRISALPVSIGNLTHLNRLDISANRLSALPEEINNLSTLETLDYSFNRIRIQPQITLASLSDHIFHNNPFSQQGVRVPIETPQAIISHLGETAGISIDLERFSPLGLDVDTNLHLWLIGLVSSAEFTTGTEQVKTHFANRALSVLNYAVENEHFKAVSLAYLADQTCDDRATKALDDLDILKEIEQAGAGTIHNAITVFTKSYIFQLSDAIAKMKMPSLPARADEIEVYLAYRQNVASRLGIPLGSTHMRYEGASYLTEEDYQAAHQAIQEALEDTGKMVKSFISHRTWKELLDKTYGHEKEECFKEKDEAATRLEETKDTMTDGDFMLEYNRITAERAQLEQKWYEEKTKTLLTRSSYPPD